MPDEIESSKFVQERYVELEKERTALVYKITELAEKTGGRLELANERIGKLESALSKIKGRTFYDWILLTIQSVLTAAVIAAFFGGYNVQYNGLKIEKPSITASPMLDR